MARQRDGDAARLQAARIERVLLAEQAAGAQLDAARREAAARLQAARDDALAIVNRAGERIARWQEHHARALQERLQAQRARADRAAREAPVPDEAALQAAVRRVARDMTTPADDGAH